MNNRARMTIVFAVLLVLVLLLTACEKDRPVPTPTSGTAQPQSGQPLTTPGSTATRGAVSADTTTTSSSSSTSQATVSAGASTPKPTTSSAATGGSGTKVAGQGTVYTVQLGDTLGGIAKEFGVSAESIVQANSLADPDVLMVGQELKIPGTQAGSEGTAETEASGESGQDTYVVSQGDTLGNIAKRLGVSVVELQELNEIANPNQIFPGQVLQIPGAASESPASSASDEQKTYVVQQGDTLIKIALRFGITLEALETANNITDPNKVYPGQVLKIP
jgi:LysM repeat protein